MASRRGKRTTVAGRLRSKLARRNPLSPEFAETRVNGSGVAELDAGTRALFAEATASTTATTAATATATDVPSCSRAGGGVGDTDRRARSRRVDASEIAPALRPYDNGAPMTVQYTRDKKGDSTSSGNANGGSRRATKGTGGRQHWNALTPSVDPVGITGLRVVAGERPDPPWDTRPLFAGRPETEALSRVDYAQRADLRRDAPADVRETVVAIRRSVLVRSSTATGTASSAWVESGDRTKMVIPSVTFGDRLVLPSTSTLHEWVEAPTAGSVFFWAHIRARAHVCPPASVCARAASRRVVQ
jgi:hypothetical protein